MIPFKKVHLQYPENKGQVEQALRNLSLKRNRSLDFSAGGMLAGTDKRFFGHEGKKFTNFTRIRYYIGDFMPRVIVRFPKDENNKFYQMRLSFLSTVIFCFLSCLFFTGLIAIFFNPEGIEALFTFFIAYLIFNLLLFIEIKLTTRQINNAILNYKSADK